MILFCALYDIRKAVRPWPDVYQRRRPLLIREIIFWRAGSSIFRPRAPPRAHGIFLKHQQGRSLGQALSLRFSSFSSSIIVVVCSLSCSRSALLMRANGPCRRRPSSRRSARDTIPLASSIHPVQLRSDWLSQLLWLVSVRWYLAGC